MRIFIYNIISIQISTFIWNGTIKVCYICPQYARAFTEYYINHRGHQVQQDSNGIFSFLKKYVLSNVTCCSGQTITILTSITCPEMPSQILLEIILLDGNAMYIKHDNVLMQLIYKTYSITTGICVNCIYYFAVFF